MRALVYSCPSACSDHKPQPTVPSVCAPLTEHRATHSAKKRGSISSGETEGGLCQAGWGCRSISLAVHLSRWSWPKGGRPRVRGGDSDPERCLPHYLNRETFAGS